METDSPPWRELLAHVRTGNEDAARKLVEVLYPTVIKIVRAHRPRRDDEEDIAQEVFLKMFTKLHQYAGEQPFDHWVSRIALNTCYDRLRRQRARRVIPYSELDLDEATYLQHALSDSSHDDAPSPANSTRGELARDLLHQLIATLKPREQLVIRLLDLEEHSVQETCDLTGWGASKVKVTAHRARRKLSESLQRLERPTQA